MPITSKERNSLEYYACKMFLIVLSDEKRFPIGNQRQRDADKNARWRKRKREANQIL